MIEESKHPENDGDSKSRSLDNLEQPGGGEKEHGQVNAGMNSAVDFSQVFNQNIKKSVFENYTFADTNPDEFSLNQTIK